MVGTLEAAALYGEVYVVSAHGPLDARIAKELRDVLIPLAAADGADVYLDLEDAHGLDRESLAVVAAAAHLAQRRGNRLRIVVTSAFTLQLITECGLVELVDVVPSLREALDR